MTTAMELGVRAEGLGKQYAADSPWALKDVDLEVPAGSVLGLLGHNGAGKTTMLRILTTLARPSAGRAWVAGHDVVQDSRRVREQIGVAGQHATVDGLLTARANLEMVGRLYHLSRTAARQRADELLDRVNLADVATKRVDTFSGGMRRRLDLAAALVAKPPVLFLDEPTAGLDPHARNELWALLKEHVRAGATLVLTTQYLDEADRLADDIIVLDHGAVVARGTPVQLKSQVGGQRFVVTLAREQQVGAARAALAPFVTGSVMEETDPARLVVPVGAATRLVQVVRALDAAGIDATDVSRREATLDDVFLALTTTGSGRVHTGASAVHRVSRPPTSPPAPPLSPARDSGSQAAHDSGRHRTDGTALQATEPSLGHFARRESPVLL